jgi:hypothetical protein
MSKLAFRAQTVDTASLPLRQEFVGKKRFNDRSKGFRFGQQPIKSGLFFEDLESKSGFLKSHNLKPQRGLDHGAVTKRIHRQPGQRTS